MMSWGRRDVRVYAADAWVSLAPRFAAEYPLIVDRIDTFLDDPAPAVRLQVAQNLQVISGADFERMWSMGERIVVAETNIEVLVAYLGNPLRNFSHVAPERCEAMLSTIKTRFDSDNQMPSPLLELFGSWIAQLFAGQGRPLARIWLEEWALNPDRYQVLLDSFTSAMRGIFFGRYSSNAHAEECAMCDRAQDGLSLVLTSAVAISTETHAIYMSDAVDAEKENAVKRYRGAEAVIHHATMQLYFGSGAHTENPGQGEGAGLPDSIAMARFLNDYAQIFPLLASSHEPSTLHYLIELYEFVIPGNPIAVFESIYDILLGRGANEGYHYESLGNTAIVRIVQRYIADYRAIFDDEDRRARLVEILQLFSQAGWSEAVNLLYDIPDLLR